MELDPRHRRIYERHLQRERQKVLGLIDDVDRNRFTILRSLTLLRQPQPASRPDRPTSTPSWAARSSTRCWSSSPRSSTAGTGPWSSASSPASSRTSGSGSTPPASPTATSTAPAATAPRSSTGSRTATAPVFLISLKAGGFGMNLTEADYCFLLDPWWNPATEAQAVDRTHRIGQTRNVMVYRLIARDTIEEKVMALAKRKAAAVRRRDGRRRLVRHRAHRRRHPRAGLVSRYSRGRATPPRTPPVLPSSTDGDRGRPLTDGQSTGGDGALSRRRRRRGEPRTNPVQAVPVPCAVTGGVTRAGWAGHGGCRWRTRPTRRSGSRRTRPASPTPGSSPAS